MYAALVVCWNDEDFRIFCNSPEDFARGFSTREWVSVWCLCLSVSMCVSWLIVKWCSTSVCVGVRDCCGETRCLCCVYYWSGEYGTACGVCWVGVKIIVRLRRSGSSWSVAITGCRHVRVEHIIKSIHIWLEDGRSYYLVEETKIKLLEIEIAIFFE